MTDHHAWPALALALGGRGMTHDVLNLRDFGVGGVKPRPWGPFDLPPDVVRIDRGGPWGNPYRIGEQHPDVTFTAPMTREGVVLLFRRYAVERLAREPGWLEPLRGKRLACWCAPLACHADVLLELANR